RGDDADFLAVLMDLHALARRRPIVGANANTLARWSELVFAQDAPGAGEVAGFAAALLDYPGEIGSDRRCRRIEVVAVEAKTCLEPQRVARAQANRLHLRVGEQRFGQIPGVFGANENLVTVFAGIAAARNGEAPETLRLDAAHGHEAQVVEFAGDDDACDLRGGRPLQCEQAAVVGAN